MKIITKRVLSIILVVTLLSFMAPPLVFGGVYDSFAGDDYYLKLMTPDMQAFQDSEYLSWSGSTPLNGYFDQTTTYLAKNEKEGFQVFFYEKGDGRELRLEIGEYVNDNGDVLPHSIFKEEYFSGCVGVNNKVFAEALVPYGGETVHVDNGKNMTFYVELSAATDQPAGTYMSHFTVYDGNEVVRTAEITAVVWDFVLPEAHYSTTIMGLYNASSGYGATQGFLEKSGIRFNGYEVVEEDLPEAERILEGWQDFLLDHGVTTYEIPRFLMDTDQKAAELRLADPRRHAFTVPQYAGRDTVISDAGLALIQSYKDLCYDNPFIRDKAVFYVADDNIDLTQEANASIVDTRLAQIKSIWQNPHVVIPTVAVNESNLPLLKERTDILCVNQALGRVNQTYYDALTDGDWYRTWRYSSNDYSGCFAMSRYGKTPMGVYTKVFYWQQEALQSDGMLNWNCGYLPHDANHVPYDVWSEKSIYPKMGSAQANGEAIFVYESKSLGLDPATPIASIRLKHISDGMDDYDYLQLAKERFGTGPDSPYTQAMNRVLQYYTSKGPKYIFSSEKSMWPDGGNYEFVGHDGKAFTEARIILGNALSSAGVTHNFGPWEIAVEPDATHDGLQIRTCADCGTEESRSMALHEHTFGDYVMSKEGSSTVMRDGYVFGLQAGITSLDDYITVKDGYTLSYDTSATIGTGMIISAKKDDRVFDSCTVVIFGDVNGDGWYDGSDAFLDNLISMGVLPESVLTEAQRMAADCNHDGLINEADVVLLEQSGLFLSNVDQTLPQEELQTNSAYLAYCNLIDQSVSAETEEDSASVPAEEPVPVLTDMTESEAKGSVFYNIIVFFNKIIDRLFSVLKIILYV